MLNIAFFDAKPLSLPKVDLGKIWSLLKVTEPRFEKVLSIMDKHQDPRELPEPLAEVYHDNTLGKLFLVGQFSYKEKNRHYQGLSTLFEVKSLDQLHETMTESELGGVNVKVPPVDTADEMVSFLRTQSDKDGYIFRDQRKRHCKVRPNVSGTLRALLG